MNDQKAPAELEAALDTYGNFPTPINRDRILELVKRVERETAASLQNMAIECGEAKGQLKRCREDLAEAQAKITNLEVDLATSRLEKKFTTCMDCGEQWEYDDFEEGPSASRAHRAVCPEHPMRALEVEAVELRKAGQSLANNVQGLLGAWSDEIRQVVGNTNVAVMEHWLSEWNKAMGEKS